MRKVLTLAAAIAAFAFPTASHAQFSLAGRLGVGFGGGNVGDHADGSGSLAMGDWVSARVPMQIDAMFRLNPGFALGAYASWAPGVPGGDLSTNCDTSGVTCTASIARIGLQGTYSFRAATKVVPWVGVGFGYEWNSMEMEEGGYTVKVTYKGWEWLNVQGGVAFRIGRIFSLGPYALLSFGRYDKGDVSGSFGTGSGSITNKTVHEWYDVGARAKFDF